MGVRLSVTWDNGYEHFECKHKYYGYKKLDSSESYKYIHDILKVSKTDKVDMLQGLYDYWAEDAGPYTLSENEFKLFVELYCKDLYEVFPGKEVGDVEMLKDISTKPGSKQIDWG